MPLDDRATGVSHPAVKRAVREIGEDPHSTIRPAYSAGARKDRGVQV